MPSASIKCGVGLMGGVHSPHRHVQSPRSKVQSPKPKAQSPKSRADSVLVFVVLRRRTRKAECNSALRPILYPLSSILVFAVLLASIVPVGAADGESSRASAFQQAEAKYKVQPENLEAAWQFARACFDAADAATNKNVRAQMAERGITVCRDALARSSNSAPVHYYLGLNLGQLASTRGLSALKLVSQMESELLIARQLDPRFDYGGPDRSLGLLYRDAPSMLSVGSKSKARRCLEQAIQLAPHYPENRLEFIDTLLKWGERDGARRELKALEAIWPAAQSEFSGPAWAASWNDWNAKFQQLKARLQEPNRLETPRH